MGDLLMKQ
ncbi:hypothetical protein VTH82DRAFT_8742 [Thermothelomyces myriococcoides]